MGGMGLPNVSNLTKNFQMGGADDGAAKDGSADDPAPGSDLDDSDLVMPVLTEEYKDYILVIMLIN